MVKDEGDEGRLRKGRRQEAIRRAIERETEGLRRRSQGSDSPVGIRPRSLSPSRALVDVSVNLETRASSSSENPILPPPVRSGISPPPPPPISHWSRLEASHVQVPTVTQTSSATREVGTQTDFYHGLTYQQMCDMNLLTTNGNRPSAVHLFPNCHALRNTTSVQTRRFCTYCVTGARQGI